MSKYGPSQNKLRPLSPGVSSEKSYYTYSIYYKTFTVRVNDTDTVTEGEKQQLT